MNPIMLGLIKLAIPMIENMALHEWQNLGLPACQGIANKLEAGKGKEEALILVEALDKIVTFEASRQV